MSAGSITNEQIGEYISAMSNGATISNQPFGYLVWGIDDNTEMKRIQKDFTTLLQEEKNSQNQLINAFKILGYEL
ncbi:MAG: putative DNA binding domain-containing protein, partial [Bacteroidota bacterium]|nr:putative DNA binding domain-containing protein [Bacteroidota bacterium]